MLKAVAVQTLFLVVVIGTIILFSLKVFWSFMEAHGIQATAATCTAKRLNYCEQLLTGQNPNWDTPPKDEECRNIKGFEDFRKPSGEEECRSILGET